MGKFSKFRALVQCNVGFIDHQPHLQPLRPCTSDKGGQGACLVVTVSVVALGAPLGARHALRGGKQHHACVRLLIAAIVEAAGCKTGGIRAQCVFGLLHQRHERHEPEPQHIALRTHALQHLADDESLARPRGCAQQTRRRWLAQQGARHTADQVALKLLGLHRHALRGHANGGHGPWWGREHGVHAMSP